MMKCRSFKASDLALVAPAPPPDNPPLAVGDYCRLNSGSPLCLVVDMVRDDVMIAFRGVGKAGLETSEWRLPRACVRRAGPPPPGTTDRVVEATL